MTTIQITIDTPLLKAIDREVKLGSLTRSAAVREALKDWMRKKKIQMLEAKDREGYRKQPQTKREKLEAALWEGAQVWGPDETW